MVDTWRLQLAMRVKYLLLICVQNQEKIGLRAHCGGVIRAVTCASAGHPGEGVVTFQVRGAEARPQESTQLARRRMFALHS